ncbi:uncharacterized protein LOC116938315 isoform X2 [Petromyzon marinus]
MPSLGLSGITCSNGSARGKKASSECAGCLRPISERYYLLAVDRAWHTACLRCCDCARPLESELTCFSKDGAIYCKRDYYRRFSVQRCARCHLGIAAAELVMRARAAVYHVACFTCSACSGALEPGEPFSAAPFAPHRLYCRQHLVPVSHSVSQSLSQLVTHPVSHSVSQSLSQSPSQSLSHSVTQSRGLLHCFTCSGALEPGEPFSAAPFAPHRLYCRQHLVPVSHSVSQSLSQLVTHPVSHSVSQSLSQSPSQSLSHSVTQSRGLLHCFTCSGALEPGEPFSAAPFAPHRLYCRQHLVPVSHSVSHSVS